VTSAAHPQVGFRDVELIQSGNLAQDTFVRQMKRYRKLKGISLERVAQVVADLQGVAPHGGALGVTELERLENGTRLLKGAEAELIAAALDTSVGWLLGSAFSSDVPDEMKAPPTDDELQAEAKAVERRMADLGMRVNMAQGQYAEAKEREEAARQQAHLAQAILNQAVAEQRDMERQFQYLLGRIDSLRAAKGEELIMQVHPVYEHDEERSEEKAHPKRAHTASGDKAGTPYPGSKAEQSRREELTKDAARKLI
jgi:transcriptional regulator with XRE-family HTH domain